MLTLADVAPYTVAWFADQDHNRAVAAENAEKSILLASFTPDPMDTLIKLGIEAIETQLAHLVQMSDVRDPEAIDWWRSIIRQAFMDRYQEMLPHLAPAYVEVVHAC